MGHLQLVCAACGWTPGSLEMDPYPFRCPRAGSDDGDHVVISGGAGGGRESQGGSGVPTDSRPPLGLPTPSRTLPTPSRNPFIRYRTSLYSWQVAGALKPCSADADREYCALVEDLDAAVARVAGTGCHITPLLRGDRLSHALGFDASGGVWVKDETQNVSGSHKARHLVGVALYLEVLRRLGIDSGGNRPLAVASCGNAALAAAVVARAMDRKLLVFVPDHASAVIVGQLEHLGAIVRRCSRDSGHGAAQSENCTGTACGARAGSAAAPSGDPCYIAFRQAVEAGALPFSCQGNENGLVVEGGATIGWEIVEQMGASPRAAPASAGQRLGLAAIDRLFVQVGGGALASACIHAFAESVRAGDLAAMPRIHAVQTCGAYPLKRAYDLLVAHVLERLAQTSRDAPRQFPNDDARASYVLREASADLLDESFRYARTHRTTFMRPWETEPQSIAAGILDDETYDWAAVVEGMVRTGGFPVVADEATLKEANRLARETTGIDVDHTGSSGLAGLFALCRGTACAGAAATRPGPAERIVVLFTGVRRS